MTISVLIAAYNAGPYIEEALASIRAQTHSDWELIVVEDGSHDRTEEIIEQFAKTVSQPVRYENLGVNRGVAAARNRLMKLADGQAVAFIDADDLWSKDHLERGARLLSAGADVVASGVRTFDLTTQKTLDEIRPTSDLERHPISTLFHQSVIVTSSCVFLSRAIIAKTGEFDPTLRVGEDRDYWMRAGLAGGQFAIQPELTCHYAKHTSSTMARTMVVAEQVVRFYDKHRNLTAIPEKSRRGELANALISQGRLLRAQSPRESLRLFRRAWKETPGNLTIPLQLGASFARLCFAGKNSAAR